MEEKEGSSDANQVPLDPQQGKQIVEATKALASSSLQPRQVDLSNEDDVEINSDAEEDFVINTQNGPGQANMVVQNISINGSHTPIIINIQGNSVTMSDLEKENIIRRCKCKRRLDEDDLLLVHDKVGDDWRSLGNSLKLNSQVLDLIEEETPDVNQRVKMMIFRWMNWKDEKATLARLSKALFLNQKFNAILALPVD